MVREGRERERDEEDTLNSPAPPLPPPKHLHRKDEGASPLTTMFSVASISKICLGILSMTCVERGEFALDDAINSVLPEACKVVHPDYPEDVITPRHLLTHSSGISDTEEALRPGPYRTDDADSPTSLQLYIAERLRSSPSHLWKKSVRPNARRYHYSNFGMTVLGLYLQEVCKRPLEEIVRERVFEPLGMRHTAFTLAHSLELEAGTQLVAPHGHGIYGVCEWPAAGLRTTARDLLLLLEEFTAARHRILSPESAALMLPSDFRQGLGWWGRDTWYGDATGGVWTHGGFMDGIRSHLFFYPKSQVGIVLMQSGEDEYDSIVRTIESLVADNISMPLK